MPCPNCKREILASYDLSTYMLEGSCAICAHRLRLCSPRMANEIREKMRAEGMAVPPPPDTLKPELKTEPEHYSPGKYLASITFILFWVFLGAKGIYWVVHDTYYGIASHSWPTVTGRVVKTRVKYHAYHAPLSQNAYPYVNYAYTVNNQSYVNDTFSFPGPYTAPVSVVRKFLNKHHPGTNIPVYYDPNSPQHACLKLKNVDYFFISMTGTLSVIFFVVSMWMLLAFLLGITGPFKWVANKFKE